jgi:pimeloyl-ACP methyl ester carboxylesterase
MWTNPEHTAYAYTGGKPFQTDSALPCVVMLHGAQNDHSVWALQSRYLAHHGYRVLAFDLPAHGRSAGLVLPRVEAMAAWVIAQCKHLGVTQAHVIGHSMGSLIALEISGQAPSLVCSIALLGTAAPMPVGAPLLQSALDTPLQAIDQINAWSHRASIRAHTTVNPGFNPIGIGQRLMQRIHAQHGSHVLPSDFAACNAYTAGVTRAAALSVPCLIMNGANDSMTPAKAAKALAASVPHAVLSLLPDCGHALMGEQPDAVLGGLLEHLKLALSAP